MKIEGGMGKSKEDAIIIKDVNNGFEGIGVEYEWLRNAYGVKDVDWSLQLQSLISDDHSARVYDLLELKLKSSEIIEIWFDITDFY